VRTPETSGNNNFTRKYIPEDNSEHHTRRRENLKSHRIDSSWGEALHSEIHTLIMLIWNKEEFPHQWKESGVAPIRKRVIKLTAVIIEAYHCYQLHTKYYLPFCSLG
jgi:hypothetical protein